MVKFILAGLIFLLSLSLIGQNLDKPFWGEHDWNGVRYGNIARNYLRYGVFNLKFAQVENSGFVKNSAFVENSGFVSSDQFEYFTHYPPLLPTLIYISYSIFGISEWSTRVIPLFFSSSLIVLIFLTGSKLWDIKTGVLASLLALSTPVILYFGKMPVHEILVVFFVSFSFLMYLYFKKNYETKYKILFALGLIFAHLSTWAGYFLLPAITAVTFLKWRKEIKKLFLFFLIPATLFLLHIIHIFIITGTLTGGEILGVFLQRSGIEKSLQPEEFNFFNYLNQLRIWFFSLYGITLTVMIIVWFLTSIKKNQYQDWLLIVLLLFGISYLVIFPNAAFIHNYLLIYMIPFAVLAASRGMISLVNKIDINFLKNLLPIILVILVYFEGKDYLYALNKSDADKFAVEVGKAINNQTNFDDKILVQSVNFSYSADKFLRFYSDRRLIYSDDVNLNHDVLVLVDQEKGKFEIIERQK